MQKLNLAFYTDTYTPAIDGVVTSISSFKKELERRGHTVYVFASSRMGQEAAPAQKNTFLYPGIGFKPYPQYSMALFPYNSISRLNKLDVDMIHAHTPFFMGFSGLIAAKLGHIPIVGSFHTMVNNKAIINDYYPKNEQLKKMTSKYLWKYVVFFYRRCGATTAPSPTIANMLERHGIDNVNMIPNSVDPEMFNTKVRGGAFRARHGIRDDQNVVLYVGRLSKEKRLEVLLKAAKQLNGRHSDLKFVIAGSGPAEQYYRELVRKLRLNNVEFLGSVGRDRLPEVYAASDVFCIPSTFETQGIVALEAMASGKPVVCADYLALKELVANGKNGEKFRPGDYAACARKIEKALNDSDTYTTGAVQTAMKYSPGKVTDKLLKVYETLLSERE